jgi:hypothetical protein
MLLHKVLAVKDNSFQVRIIAMLQLAFTFNLVENVFKFLAGAKMHSPYRLGYFVCQFSFYATDCLVHSVFAIKYWSISSKIKCTLEDIPLKRTELLTAVLYAVQLSLIASSWVLSEAAGIYYFRNNYQNLFSKKGVTCFKCFYILSPFTIVLIMADALRRFKSCDLQWNRQYAISDNQILFQTISYLSFAVGVGLRYTWFHNQSFFWVFISCNSLGFCMLMLSIFKLT